MLLTRFGWTFRCRETRRFFSTKSVPKAEVKYTGTINLPKTKFPARLSVEKRTEVENQLRKTCLSELYSWNRNDLPAENEFILHDGPPYANGDLHMGHAVNKILKDLILKHKMVSGTRVHYVPGWDCHGLPIELKALEAFNRKKHKVPGESIKTEHEIRTTARQFALETIAKQKAGFEYWGVTGAWNEDRGYYRSLDASYISAQLQLFYELYQRKLIYRDLKPVYWSPSSQSALAEAELEYDEAHQSPSLYLKVALENRGSSCSAIDQQQLTSEQVFAVIWTTTPWTLPANQAICYNPALNYSLVRSSSSGELLLVGTDLVAYLGEQLESSLAVLQTIPGTALAALKYHHPLQRDKILPFLPASHVKAEKGTGLVHTAPAHGPEDFLVCLERKISIENLINERGLYNDHAPPFLRGKYALTEGNTLVTEALKDCVLKLSSIVHSYPIDWRTKRPVMLRASDQWFIDTNRLKERALEEIRKVDIYPHTSSEVSKKVIEGQLSKRPYWCISRQRAWGVPIPVLYDTVTKEPIVSKDLLTIIEDRLKRESTIDFWWTSTLEDLVPAGLLHQLGSPNRLEKGKDILDIWFDSGVSWLSVLGNDRVADLYLEGIDQFTGWFQSSLLTSVAARGTAPYKAIFVHGFAVDENGMKMSKSLGNVICPRQIAQQYGCDALRWWVCAHATQNTSIPVSHKLLGTSAENVQKLRGILKFLLGVVAPDGADNSRRCAKIQPDRLHHIDRYYLQQLESFHRTVFALYDSYQHNKATAIILNFCQTTLSGLYLHVIKDRLYCGTSEEHSNLKAILDATYRIVSKVLWPIVPFLVEESWMYYEKDYFYKSNRQHTPDVSPLADPRSATAVECALELRHSVYQQAQLNVNTWLLEVAIECNDSDLTLLSLLHPTRNESDRSTELCELLQVGAVTLLKASAGENRFTVAVKKSDKPLCQRCRRYLVSEQDKICERCNIILSQR
ncbi:isoleucine--tRNA ligase, mitochondrial [Anopheles maculipalpis]|uniref:isoleucine--tRNA ligase, mitochondrial n=1 Tax=Anopheles maculipalpis TaxID=1496333 RepID=UPI00215934E8|nr:isoleucine--tRNA ligase, mitochondrial [Anopheles maculipalpis]